MGGFKFSVQKYTVAWCKMSPSTPLLCKFTFIWHLTSQKGLTVELFSHILYYCFYLRTIFSTKKEKGQLIFMS